MSAASAPQWEGPGFHPQRQGDADFLRQFSYVPGIRELLIIRQVHALEHATVWVLDELPRSRPAALGGQSYGGLSTEQGFYLYGDVSTQQLQRAVRVALRRLMAGDWNLAIHPRCGTNVSVGMTLAASLALGLHVVLPKGPIEQLLGLGAAAAAAAQITPELGALVQRHLTTAIPFNLTVDTVIEIMAGRSQPTHFVQVHWQD